MSTDTQPPKFDPVDEDTRNPAKDTTEILQYAAYDPPPPTATPAPAGKDTQAAAAATEVAANQFMVNKGFASAESLLGAATGGAAVAAFAAAGDKKQAGAGGDVGGGAQGKDVNVKPAPNPNVGENTVSNADDKNGGDKKDDKSGDDKDKKPAKQPTELDKKIDDLIKKLGDDDFVTRQEAQADLEKLGSGAYEKLGQALKNDDPEIRHRAAKARANILKQDPSPDGKTVGDAHEAALKEIGKDGKISDKTAKDYEKLIKDMDGKKMSEEEAKARKDELTKKAYDFKADPKERIDALRQMDRLNAAARIDAGSQARLDYADALTKSGDKGKALDVLKEAAQKNPALSEQASFKVLAQDAGAAGNKDFMDAVSKATGGKVDLKSDFSNARRMTYERNDHLSHEADRKGMTPSVQKQWQDHLAAIDKEAAANPDLKAFYKVAKEGAQKEYVNGLTSSGKSEDATKVMTDMLKNDPAWVNAAWMRNMSELNGSRKNADFTAAVKEARKTVKEQFDGQGDP